MDVDGIRTLVAGTSMWAVATLGLIPFWATLMANGTQWWLWTAVAGFGLGLMGIEYCRRRRNSPEDIPASGTSGGRRRK